MSYYRRNEFTITKEGLDKLCEFMRPRRGKGVHKLGDVVIFSFLLDSQQLIYSPGVNGGADLLWQLQKVGLKKEEGVSPAHRGVAASFFH